MLSSNYLGKIKKLWKFLNIERVSLRNIEESNNIGGSMFNEFLCSNIRFKKDKGSDKILFQSLKKYISICVVEHIILDKQYRNFHESNYDVVDIKKFEKPINLLLKDCEEWIKKCEELFLEKPYVCVTCGLRLIKQPDGQHNCQEMNLITHICPCGRLFDNHQHYLSHVQPREIKYFSSFKSGLPIPDCKFAGLQWLLTWLDLACESNKKDLKVCCYACNKSYSNFVTWFIHYSKCIKHEMLMCQICSDVMGGLIDDDFPKINSIFLPLTKLKLPEISLYSLSGYFFYFQHNKGISPNDIMSLIGFENVFHFELNKCLKLTRNSEKIRVKENELYICRQLQFVKFFTMFPQICNVCFERFDKSNDKKTLSIKHQHQCRGLTPEEHVCVCSARFHNHENYTFHRLYRCQFLLFVHISLLMIPNRTTLVYSLCNRVCKPIHDLSGLRDHWKTCRICHIKMIRGCKFCSDTHKLKYKKNQYVSYFTNLIQSKDLMIKMESKNKTSARNAIFNSGDFDLNNNQQSCVYRTRLCCLKSGPPFNLIELSRQKELSHPVNKKRKLSENPRARK